MRLLILGGTLFLGRHVASAALQRGHAVTLFHRGEHPATGLEGAEDVLGDRTGDLVALAGRSWDAAIDTSGYDPDVVARSATALAGCHYTFVSSISAYGDLTRPGLTEDAEPADDDEYGGRKARCEAVLREPALIIRPGLIVGPHDPTDRFTYWVRRGARGGEVLAPGEPERQVQLIDVRDLAGWLLDLVEQRATGTFNATGPAGPLSMGELVGACLGEGATATWVAERFLISSDVEPWTEIPLWIPDIGPDALPGMLRVSIERALGAGLRLRPLPETVRDTLAWDRERGEPPLAEGIGLTPEREAALLRNWRPFGPR
jgi:2'-hydroxyisoflavone reductase